MKVSFRNLYSLVVDPKGWVWDSFDVDGNIWSLRLRRNLNDWELDDLGRMLALLEDIKSSPSLKDGWEWVISKKGKFTP